MSTQTVALRQKYTDTVVPELQKRHDYQNVMAVPKLTKIVLNMGLGEARDDSKVIEKASSDISKIALQRPVVTRAKKSVSNFKLRAGMPIGLTVTLRGERMWVFLEKLVNIALPAVRDFRGTNPNSFDGRGNYSMGLREQLVFPELSYDQIDGVRGLDIAIVTTADTDEEARDLLELLGMPFRK